jgi:hypothetical protein
MNANEAEMDAQTCTKFRWFWAWQDEKEEQWLDHMSEQGWHVISMGLPGIYQFIQGEPRSYVYRLDFKPSTDKDFKEYLQLFSDAGWDHIGMVSSWQYFRIEAKEGEQPEIFTDNASKIRKYERLVGFLVIFLPIFIIMIHNLATAEREIYKVFSVIFAAFILFYAYAMIRIVMRIQQLKKP